MALSSDERTWFDIMLISREVLIQRRYPKNFLLGWDLWQACDLIRRYVFSAISQLIRITIHLDK